MITERGFDVSPGYAYSIRDETSRNASQIFDDRHLCLYHRSYILIYKISSNRNLREETINDASVHDRILKQISCYTSEVTYRCANRNLFGVPYEVDLLKAHQGNATLL